MAGNGGEGSGRDPLPDVIKPSHTGGVKTPTGNAVENLSAGASPTKVSAAITNQEWADYQADFVPIENSIIEQVSGQGDVNSSANRAGSRVSDSFAGAAGQNARGLARAGITATADQKSSITRSTGLSSVLAKTTAENTTRTAVNERNVNSQGDLIGLGRGIADSSSRTSNEAANLEASRTAANDQLAAQKTQGALTNMGAGAAIGFQVGQAPGAFVGAGVGLLASLF